MFNISGSTITLTRGDTGSVTFGVTGADFTAKDRVLFTIKNGAGTIMYQEAYQVVSNAFNVVFTNEMTDDWAPGSYAYDIRCVFSPAYDDKGNIVNGASVQTPPINNGSTTGTINILTSVGEV